jgi:hypothetical protein
MLNFYLSSTRGTAGVGLVRSCGARYGLMQIVLVLLIPAEQTDVYVARQMFVMLRKKKSDLTCSRAVNSRRPRPRPTLCPRAASVAEFLVPDAQHCCFLSLTPWRAITGPQQDISRGKRGRGSSGETALAAECGLDNHVNICNLRPSAHATRTLTRCKTMWLRQAHASKAGEDAHHEDALWRFGPQV